MAMALNPAESLRSTRNVLTLATFWIVQAALPELRRAVEGAELSPMDRRSANRALREVDEGTGLDAYWRQPTWKRVSVIFAGPLANILVAFVIFFAVYNSGAPSQTPM